MEAPEKKAGKFFSLAPTDAHKLCQRLIQTYHSDLDSAAVKVDLVLAFRDPEGEAPAMEKDGHRIMGKASILNLKDRVKGMGDCEIILDGDAWDGLPEKQKAALMDHELEHFEVKRDKEGSFLYDDMNRPMLKIRNHDRQFGWFDTVAQRHRSDSLEVAELQRLFTEAGQIYLPFVKGNDADLSERIDKALEGKPAEMSVSVNGAPPVPMSFAGLSRNIEERMEEMQ
jgi:hypothetical protein